MYNFSINQIDDNDFIVTAQEILNSGGNDNGGGGSDTPTYSAVASVNGQTGEVHLTAADVGALPDGVEYIIDGGSAPVD